MTSEEWIEMFRFIPEHEHGKLVITLKTGAEVAVDTLFRFETNFLVVRGRLAGTIDEARGFLLPYDQMVSLRLERVVKLDELKTMFGDSDGSGAAVPSAGLTPTQSVSKQPTPTSAPTDPATASRLLMERIRAARASSPALPRPSLRTN